MVSSTSSTFSFVSASYFFLVLAALSSDTNGLTIVAPSSSAARTAIIRRALLLEADSARLPWKRAEVLDPVQRVCARAAGSCARVTVRPRTKAGATSVQAESACVETMSAAWGMLRVLSGAQRCALVRGTVEVNQVDLQNK
eukprot:246684-Prorocentrum_minimum.AAC.1